MCEPYHLYYLSDNVILCDNDGRVCRLGNS